MVSRSDDECGRGEIELGIVILLSLLECDSNTERTTRKNVYKSKLKATNGYICTHEQTEIQIPIMLDNFSHNAFLFSGSSTTHFGFLTSFIRSFAKSKGAVARLFELAAK